MANTTLRGFTYEVYANDGGRWLLDTSHRVRTRALARAQERLAAKNCDAVRVTSQKDGWSRIEVILEEAVLDRPTKALKVIPIDSAPACREIIDYYAHPSRKTIGRVLRQYLDEAGITPVELLFSVSHLNMLERRERYFVSAVNLVGGVQARAAESGGRDQTDLLFRAFERIRDRARDLRDVEDYRTHLEHHGLPSLLREVSETIAPENRHVYRLGALAAYLGEAGDWNAKLGVLLTLADQDLDHDSTVLLDEMLAELLDGAAAVAELLGGMRDNVTAFQSLVRLSAGRCPVPPRSPTVLQRLNDRLALGGLPLTVGVLLDRVARGLKSVVPLTREGREADRAALLNLIRDLVGVAGLVGGPIVSEALTLRVKSTLSESDNDLDLDACIEKMLMFMPSRAARLGYLLDLSQTPLGERHRRHVLERLLQLIGQITSIRSLVPAGTSHHDLVATIDQLRVRVGMEGLPQSLRESLGQSLDRLMKKVAQDNEDGPPSPSSSSPIRFDDRTKPMVNDRIERKTVDTGVVLFEEGDAGDEAYIITDGEVEIFRRVGNRDVILAVVGRGDVIGEMSLIDDQPRMASARALQGTELVVISREGLQKRLEWLGGNDRVLRRLLDVLVQRLRGLARTAE